MGQIQSSDRDLRARLAEGRLRAPVAEDDMAPLLVIKPSSPPSSSEAREHIREALVLGGLTDADTIHVETRGTQITLTGTVRSWAESNQACHAAWSLPGVTDVDNRLRVV